MSKHSETSKQVTDARLVSLGELTKLDDLDGGEKGATYFNLKIKMDCLGSLTFTPNDRISYPLRKIMPLRQGIVTNYKIKSPRFL